MANVIFSHPLIVNDLHIKVKPDQVTWAYGLNTASFPTYGGEVVQILSVFFDDMTVSGTVASYAEMEAIYGWFITYMQYATQGRDNPSYDQHPVTFNYPERHWQFQIWPKALPGFRYGRDVVAPTWTLVAAVKEPDASFADLIKNFAATTGPEAQLFGKATADFGASGDLANNPWASAGNDPRQKGQTTMQYLSSLAKHEGDTFSGFVTSYSNGDLSSLLPNISKAAPSVAKTSTKSGKGTKTHH